MDNNLLKVAPVSAFDLLDLNRRCFKIKIGGVWGIGLLYNEGRLVY